MAIALSPILRFGPGGDFLSDVFADRLEGSAPIAAGESGDFDPGSSSGSPGDPGAGGGQSPSRSRTDDLFESAGSMGGSSLNKGAEPAGGPDGLELSALARRAGGLLVAQRLLAVHSLTLGAAATLITSMLATIHRASEPVRTLRHPADRAGALTRPDSESPQSSLLKPRDSVGGSMGVGLAAPSSLPRPVPRSAVPSRVPSLFASHAADHRHGVQP